MTDIRVADNPQRYRFEIQLDGRTVGYSAYHLTDGRITFTHTHIDPTYEGRGLGSRLATDALNEVRDRGLAVVPRCPFIDSFIKGHPEYADLVVPGSVPSA
jgi:uncharacterized protein